MSICVLLVSSEPAWAWSYMHYFLLMVEYYWANTTCGLVSEISNTQFHDEQLNSHNRLAAHGKTFSLY